MGAPRGQPHGIGSIINEVNKEYNNDTSLTFEQNLMQDSGAGGPDGQNGAIADNTDKYATVQEALTNATTHVTVLPGTYVENLSVTTAGLTIEGFGRSTVIDGGPDLNAIEVQASDVTIRNLVARTDSGGYNGIKTISGSGVGCTIEGVRIPQTGYYGIYLDAEYGTVRDCEIENTADAGVLAGVNNQRIENTRMESCYQGITNWGNDVSIRGVNVLASGWTGIYDEGARSSITDCRVTNSAGRGIQLYGTNQLIDSCVVYGWDDANYSAIDTTSATTPTVGSTVEVA